MTEIISVSDLEPPASNVELLLRWFLLAEEREKKNLGVPGVKSQ